MTASCVTAVSYFRLLRYAWLELIQVIASKFHVEMTASLVVDVVIVQLCRIQEKSSLSLMTIKDFWIDMRKWGQPGKRRVERDYPWEVKI